MAVDMEPESCQESNYDPSVPIQVAVRVRPVLREMQTTCIQLFPESEQLVIGGEHVFSFERIFSPSADQNDIFEDAVLPLVETFLEGQDVTILAYGQSESGKTYTLVGPELSCAMNEEDFGIVQRVFRSIFQSLQNLKGLQSVVHVAYVEVFQEQVRDVLNWDRPGSVIQVEQDPQGKVVMQGLHAVECHDTSEALRCVDIGSRSRLFLSAENSAESHSMLLLTLTQRWLDPQSGLNQQRSTQFTFVDLAPTRKRSPMGLVENPGLRALYNVIRVLSFSSPSSFPIIPYWDSLLTALLKESLGGSSRTLVLCCVSPCVADFWESLYSLQWARQFSFVRNHPTAHSFKGSDMGSICNGNLDEPGKGSEAGSICNGLPNKEPLDESENLRDQIFKLQFAAQQYQQLVANAEDLLSAMSGLGNLTSEQAGQITSWLCLKAECEECIAGDIGGDEDSEVSRATKRRGEIEAWNRIAELEVIAEMTEPPSECAGSLSMCNEDDDDEEDEEEEEEEEVDEEAEEEEMEIKLRDLRLQLEIATDNVILSFVHQDNLLFHAWQHRPFSQGPEKVCMAIQTDTVQMVHAQTSVRGDEGWLSGRLAQDLREAERMLHDLSMAIKKKEKQLQQLEAQSKTIEEPLPLQTKGNKDQSKPSPKKGLQPRVRRGGVSGPSGVDGALVGSVKESEDEPVEEVGKGGLIKRKLAQFEKRFLEAQELVRSSFRKSQEKKLQGSEETLMDANEGPGSSLKEKGSSKMKVEDGLFKNEGRTTSGKELEESKASVNACNQSSGRPSSRSVSTSTSGDDSSLLDANHMKKEVAKLRKLRECLIEERQYIQGSCKVIDLGAEDERRYVELDETISAIDEAIEHKNCILLQGRDPFASSTDVTGDELLDRVLNLTESESKSLLCKYFRKVIDLREEACRHDAQCAELEGQLEDQGRCMQELSAALQQSHLERERRIMVLQRDHQRHVSELMQDVQHADSGTGNVSVSGMERKIRALEKELSYYRKSSREYKKRLREVLDGRLPGEREERGAGEGKGDGIVMTIPAKSLAPLAKATPPGPAMTTKVTRERNKIVIQKQPQPSSSGSSAASHHHHHLVFHR